MRRGLAAVVAASLALAVPTLARAAGPAPWKAAGDAHVALSDAQAALVLGDRTAAAAKVSAARANAEAALAGYPAALAAVRQALDDAERAAARGDDAGVGAAKSTVWSALLDTAFVAASRAAASDDVELARSWLLVREFRPPTRFSRAAADATVALDGLEAGTTSPRAAARVVRHDLLDTYDSRLRTALASLHEADELGYAATRAEMSALALGYWRILVPAYRAQRGAERAREVTATLERLAAAGRAGASAEPGLARIDAALEAFRAAPLAPEELRRRAGQLERFLKLVPIEFGRGVDDGRVTLEFEIQEAITFRDGAAAAFHDVEPSLLARDTAATAELRTTLDELGTTLTTAIRGERVAAPEHVETVVDGALALVGDVYPASWKEASKTADFDVIAATLDRMQAAAAAGDWKQAESARLEAYGVFELGPEQRLRGLAPSLFQEVEGYFWYGAGGHDGLVQLIKQRSAAGIAPTRSALDDALTRAEERIGSGPQSQLAVMLNAAIIVFREGLEAVLILAALTASLVGGQRRFRRPLLAGVGVALAATALTWVVAQTVLTSLQAYGERLEAIVSLVAIGVLLLILNWFYHRVYWQENLQDLHRRKRCVLAGAGLSLAAAQVVGLVLLGFSSVYREGFETVLFLQAITLEAGALTVLEGVALGLLGVVAMFVLVIALERKLPHKKMLVATGVLITWVLVVMVGTTVQTLQKVGWIGVSPIEGLQLPYWTGLWLGLYPTWEGVLAQAAAAVFVLGSYFAAESVRRRRRARLILSTGTRAAIGEAEAG